MTHYPEAAAAVALGAALDWTVREPPERLHPVAAFGAVVARLDRSWPHALLAGLVLAAILPVAAAVAVGGLVALAGVAAARAAALVPTAGPPLHAVPVLLAALALFATTSLRSLLEVAGGVVAAAETDLAAARERLPALVGRDPHELDAEHVRSAAVESVAENLSDGLVAPLLGFVAGAVLGTWLAGVAPDAWLVGPSTALAAGAAGAAWVKAVNTLDSMLGYPDRPLGTAAARLDDAVMWLPARVTAVLLSLSAASPDHALAARRWADAPASPNAGWPMGAVASAVGARLEKPGAYDLNPVAGLPGADDARDAIRLAGRAGLLAYLLAALAGVMLWTP